MARPSATARPRVEIVIETARAEFLKNGFQETSIDSIAASAGVSKATIYRHFKSKQEILEAVIHDSVEHAPIRLVGEEIALLPPEQALAKFARSLLRSVANDDSIALFRLVISESHRSPHLGSYFFSEVTSIAVIPLSQYLEAQSKSGALRIKDPLLTAFQFIGTIKEPLFWPLLMGVTASELKYSQPRVIKQAVAGFIAHWGKT